jgi:hypothetical protein
MPVTRKTARPPARPPVAKDQSELDDAIAGVVEAAGTLFAADQRVHAVGVGLSDGRPIYRAVRNTKKIVAQALALTAKPPKLSFPVTFVEAERDAAPLLRVPHSAAAAAAAAAAIPEQQGRRPLVCGLQIQNFDDDDRQGEIKKGFMIVGTIGCFVRRGTKGPFILSNNHVVAGENRGKSGDRILQQGGAAFANNLLVAKLADFVKIKFSPFGAQPPDATVVFNDVDAGLAALGNGIAGTNAYLPVRTGVTAPKSIGKAKHDDSVLKVGRTTGLTHGHVTSVATIVGPIAYDGKPAWFRNSIEIEGDNGSKFSDHGDSGSAIVNGAGELVGLLYAGNGTQTYACPIDAVVTALGIKL